MEIERPWIAKGLGKKTFTVTVFIILLSFGILAEFNFYGGTTVNIQCVKVEVNSGKSGSTNFSFAYGKFTYGPGEKVAINLQFPIELSKYISENHINSYSIIRIQNGFNLISYGNIQNNSGMMITEIILITPTSNFYGSIFIEITLN